MRNMTKWIPKITCCVDWLSITASNKPEKLNPPDHTKAGEKLEHGMLGYTVGKKYVDGRIELHNPDRPDMGVHIIYSGDVLRVLDEVGVTSGMELAVWHIASGNRPARVDVAIDVYDYRLQVSELSEMFDSKRVVTNTRSGRFVRGLRETGDTLYIGGRKAKKMVRVYDKAKEQRIKGDWKRIELQARGAMAASVIKAVNNSGSQQDGIAGVIRGFVDFPESPTWGAIFGTKDMKLERPERGVSNRERWIIEQVLPALANHLCDPHERMTIEEFNTRLQLEIKAVIDRMAELAVRQ